MDDIERGRRLARRRMGWMSFIMLSLEACALVLGLYFGGPLFAANMAAIAPAFTGLAWAQASIVGVYLGVSLAEALKKQP